MTAHSRNVTLMLDWALAGLGVAGLLFSPIPRAYPIIILCAGIVGAVWDLRRTHFIPRLVLTLVGLAGFFFSLLPFSRETLADQSLSALSLLLAVKLLEDKERRDHLQILVLSLILVAGGASLAPEMAYVLFFLGDLLLGVFLLLWLPFAERAGTSPIDPGFVRRLLVVAGIMSAVAVPLSVIFFLILPRAANPFWFGFASRPKAVSGFSERLSLGQVGRISLSQEAAFRVEVESPAGPFPEVPYWRGIVLEVTDGKQWTVAPSLRAFAAGGGASTVRATYYVEPHWQTELFILDQPVGAWSGFRALPLSGGRVLRLGSPLRKPIRYQGFSRPSPERAEPLSDAERRLNLHLPDGFSPRIIELAKALSSGETDEQKIAGRIGSFFDRGFTYSLEAPSSGGDPLEDFLFRSRTGYCEYFAAGMAVMLRVVGIPARLVGGYLGGEYNTTGNYYLVRQAAAHTWVEAYLKGRGWVRFDPTPGSELGATLAARRSRRPLLWLDALRMRWNSWVVQYDTEVQVGFLRKAGQGLGRFARLRPSRENIGTIVLFSLLAGILWLTARLVGRRPADQLKRRWNRLQRLASRSGLPRFPWEGTLDHARRISGLRPQAAPHLIAFAERFSRLRYGGSPPSPEDLREMDRLLKAVSGTLCAPAP